MGEKKDSFIDVIDRCLVDLYQGKNVEISSRTIMMKVINHIRLGTESVDIRLKTLYRIFKWRQLIVYENSNQQIKYAYEALLEETDDPQTIIEIKNKIGQL